MKQLNKINFKFTGEYKDVDYYIRKYNISEGKIKDFNNYFKQNKFFNGDKVGIETIKYINGKLDVTYFRTNYEVAILIRNFLLGDKEIILDKEDSRASLGFEVLLKDLKGKVILTRRNKDWYGNDVSDINHYQLTTSEGIDISDVESMKSEDIFKQLILRSLKEELGLCMNLNEIISLELGFKESDNSYIACEITVDDIYKLNYNLYESEDYDNNIDDIKDVDIFLLVDLESNNEYTPVLNDYLNKEITWINS